MTTPFHQALTDQVLWEAIRAYYGPYAMVTPDIPDYMHRDKCRQMREVLVSALLAASGTPTIRCVCGHPGDTPTCPVDHDQIQHEQAPAVPPAERRREPAATTGVDDGAQPR